MLRIANTVKSPLQYVPLKQINIESIIRSFAANVTITQIFRNDESKSIETIYSFPIDEQAAIYKFTARIDDREIIAQLKEKREFQIEYNHVLEQSQGTYQLEQDEQSRATYQLEQDEQSQDTFMINVGVLPSSKECIITISYVTELDLIQGSIIRFVIPTTIAARYSPNKKSKYVQSLPYKIEVQCRIEKMYGPNQQQYISRLYSPSHPIEIDLSLQDAYIVTYTQSNAYLDRDIILDVQLAGIRANTFMVVESDAAMAAVTPFEQDCYLTFDSQQTNEFIFLVDCSGSMRDQNKIGLARDAMFFFIEHLPKNCYFNIIKFGAIYTCLFSQSTVLYNSVHIRIAEKFISEIQGNLGGTEILAPLQWLERHPPRVGRARQVFLLTDGQVANVSEILELCRSMATSTRIFSFGLGGSPSRSLIKGLARTTNGRCIFIPPNTRIDIYVKEQLEKAIQRCITNIRIQWNLGIPIETVPNRLSPAYLNDRLIIYALTNDQKIELNSKSSIEIRSDQSYYRLGIADADRITNNTQMIARLAAKALILELEHCKIRRKNFKQVRFENIDDQSNRTKEDFKQRIIDLSLRYNILSPYTTFIGIEKCLNDSNNLREVPIQISMTNQKFQSANSEFENILSDTHDVYKYSSPTSINQRFEEKKVACAERSNEHSLMKPSTLSDNKCQSYYEEHAKSNRMPLSTTDESGSFTSLNTKEFRSLGGKNRVQYLINKQQSDGLWNFDANRKTINDLTGKPLAMFQSSEINGNTQILVTAIVIISFEVKFMEFRSLWEDAVEKARQRLITLLNNDWKQLVTLFRHIRVTLGQ
ncbi:unnamed protein product [Rotaria magnacalcarata]|uniref:von Willebrand factor type A domain containing protein n=1 Tax=Rotaria magnacalcarata TaxID=392030 RepID=A0A816N015_9BILA|nr:unnamed protein product [Rotaria magnacalcarata]